MKVPFPMDPMETHSLKLKRWTLWIMWKCARGVSLVGVLISLQCGKPESKLSQYPTISGLLYLVPNRIIAYHGLPYFFLSQNDVEMIQCHFPKIDF